MSETPSWLSDENIATAVSNPKVQKAAVSAASNPVVQAAAVDAAKNPAVQNAVYAAATGDVEDQGPKPEEMNIDPAELKEMQKYALGLKLYYIACTAMLSAAAWVYVLNDAKDITKIFIAFYVFMFAVQICCFEMAIQACARVISSNFGFLYNGIGRGIYLLFVAALAANLGDLGIAAMAFLLLAVVLNIVIVFQFPKYTQWLRLKHYNTLSKK